MTWTGHKSYRSMTPYIDILTAARRAHMSRLNSLPLTPDLPSPPSLSAPSTPFDLPALPAPFDLPLSP